MTTNNVSFRNGEKIINTSISKRPDALSGFTKKPAISACTNMGRVLLQETFDWEDITPETEPGEKVMHTSIQDDVQLLVLACTDKGRLLQFSRQRRSTQPPRWKIIDTPPTEETYESRPACGGPQTAVHCEGDGNAARQPEPDFDAVPPEPVYFLTNRS